MLLLSFFICKVIVYTTNKINKRWSRDYESLHGKKAKNGWYRYNTRFALPKTDEEGVIIEYKIYKAVLLVRYSEDGKLYLYDLVNIRKASLE